MVKRIFKGKYILMAAVVLLLPAAFLFFLQRGLPVSACRVERGEVVDRFTETGVVRGGEDRALISEVSGGVEEIFFSEGSYVEEGDILARIKTENYDDAIAVKRQNIAAYQAEIEGAVSEESRKKEDMRSEMEQLRLKEREERSRKEKAERDLDRSKSLYESGDISQEEKEKAELALENAKSSLELSESRRRSLEEKLKNDYAGDTREKLDAMIGAEEKGIEQLEKKKGKCEIRAACSGYIVRADIAGLSQVAEGQQLFVIRDGKSRRAEADILTSYEPYLRVGDEVKLTQKLQGKDESCKAVISEIFGFAESSTSALGLKEYKVKLVVELEEGPALKPGSDVDLEFTIYREKEVLSVPGSAVFRSDGRDFVFRLIGNRAVKTEVNVSYKSNTVYVIKEGLSEGELVIRDADLEGLSDGRRCHAV